MSAATSNAPELEDKAESEVELQLNQTLVECNDFLNRGEFASALECLDRAVRLAPTNPDISSHRAQLLWFLKKPDLARREFARTVAISPGHIAGNAGLARCHFQTGAHAQAEVCARRVLAQDPQNQEASEVLSELEKLAGAKSAQARKGIADYFARAREEFAGVEPPPLSEWHLKNSHLLPSREKILELMPQGGICAEIGTQTGDFAKRILAHLKPAKLHIFDLDFTPFDRPAFEPLIREGAVVLHAGDSSSALARLPDLSFDFIYIDGDHSYEGVTKDLAAAAQKIKADGWIVCNDYTLYSPVEQVQYGVYRAVNEFCWQKGFEIVYLGLHYWSYHDVALRRMKPEAIALAGSPPASDHAARLVTTQPSVKTTPTRVDAMLSAGGPRVVPHAAALNTVTNGAAPSPTPFSPTPASTGDTSLPYNLDPGLSLEIGEHSYIHDHTIRNPSGALTNVSVGKFCCIATGLSVIGYDHHSEWAVMYPFLDDGHRAQWPGTHGIPYPQSPEFGSNKSRGDITIGNDVWIGSDVKIFKGVTIGDGAVIGACSLVNKSVAPYTIVAGIPARPIRKRFSDEEIKLLQQVRWWDLPVSVINRHMALLCSSRITELAGALAADPEFQHLPPKTFLAVTANRLRAKADAILTSEASEVLETIGTGDEMFTGDRAHYFGVGKSALHAIETALTATRRPREHIRKILDLPCGHGRVMRHLRAAFPQAQITACDLNRGAVDFCAQTFGAQPIYSNVDVSQIALTGGYDLVWSGSLLTHLRAGPCADFVRLFNSLVNPGGLIVFTMHGRWVERSLATRRYTYGLRETDVVAILKDYYATGFGYADYPGVSGYGISLSSPAFVLAQLVALPDLKLISYHEKGWDNHQDVVCLQKQPASEPLG